MVTATIDLQPVTITTGQSRSFLYLGYQQTTIKFIGFNWMLLDCYGCDCPLLAQSRRSYTNIIMWKYLFAFSLLVSGNVFGTDYQTTITLPECDVENSEVLIIDEVSDFSQINDVGKTIFCVEPGNYIVDLDLTRSGTAESPRYIRYFNSSETEEIHPVHMDESDRVVIEELFFLHTEHWVVDRLTVRDSITHSSVRMQPGANNITLNRMLVENSGGSSGMIAMGGSNNVIQDSVIRNTFVVPRMDDHCIVMYGANVKVVDNEIYNCAGDGIQVSGSTAPGGIIAYNEMYVNSDYYTDGNGNFDPNGTHMCAENGLDMKGAGTGSFPFSEDNQLLVIGNKIHGFNRDDDNHCGTGAGSIGIGVIIHSPVVTYNLRFEENIIFDNNMGIANANPQVVHSSFINNLLFGMDYAMTIPSNKSHNNEFYYNTFLNTSIFIYGNESTNDFLYNVFINVPNALTSSTNIGISKVHPKSNFDFNAYYNSPIAVLSNTNDLSFPTVSESLNETYCFTKFQITNPTEVCVPLAATSANSPHSNMGEATELKNVGVSDVLMLNRVEAGFKPTVSTPPDP